MKPSQLFTPGPTRVPQRIQQTLAQPLIHHRTEPFRHALKSVSEGLQYVMQTQNPVIVLTSSGTGAMEAAVANVTLPGDKVLVTACGKFSYRWIEIAEAYGIDIIPVEARWGDPVTPAQVKAALEQNDGIGVILTTHTETSTGALLDIAAIAKLAGEYGALVVVDAITSLCAQELPADDWGVDVVLGGAQKGFGVPPGLSFISLSDRAVERVRTQGHPSYYFNLSKALDSLQKWNTAYTPATPLVLAMRTSLEMIREEGLEHVIRRHARHARAVRAAVNALGLDLLPSVPCNATTPVLVKDGHAGDIIRKMESSFGIKISGGQAHLSGKIVRFGHLGFYEETDIYTMICALEGALTELGINPAGGKGIAAALQSFRDDPV
ncbi:MAG: alanine--glyoxylate aminotransferase family protein [Candidatus Latescibacterota bacterium]